MEIHCTLYQMEPSANECISIDKQSGFLQEKSSPPSQQIADESMGKPRANVARTIQLDTQMELEQAGSSQSQIVLGLPSLQETGDTQVEFEHSSSSPIILGLPSVQKIGETIKVSDINDSKSPCNPIQQEAENEIDSTEEEQDQMKLNDTTTMEEQDEPYFLTDKPYFHCILGKTQLHNMFDSSWKHFVHDNNLRFEDGCVFELTEHRDNCINFRIQILDGDIPSELLDRVEGQTIEHPITIG
ncbi:hypothetical protein C5167_005360 [Papaver somniferum]|uniref:TF-B3 domain-containing protein n=1 Tax=Papaver somniferum TaxID=3469 RepID=A0A4Y7JEJ2_PAPSO|nr:hypothetical protein C5167_005360 [Papaver somniferum]